MDSDQEAQLTQAMRAGDAHALSTLYRHYVAPVFRYIRRRVPTVEVAEDITSETFLAIVEQISSFRSESSFHTWMYTIARRRIAEYWRRHYRLPETAIEPFLLLLEGPDAGPEEERHPAPTTNVRALLAGLPERSRRVLECRFLEGMTVAETAAALTLSEGNVKVIQHRALAALANRAPSL